MGNSYTHGKMEYLRTKVLTASPEELHLMLYDGAIRFSEEAKQALQEKNFAKSYEVLVRAQNILLEMSNSLNQDANPTLTARLKSLYNYIYRRLVYANMKRDIPAIDDALKILIYQRETWVMLMDKLAQEKQNSAEPINQTPELADENQKNADALPCQPGMVLSLSV
jgi:flagellar protein FliS